MNSKLRIAAGLVLVFWMFSGCGKDYSIDILPGEWTVDQKTVEEMMPKMLEEMEKEMGREIPAEDMESFKKAVLAQMELMTIRFEKKDPNSVSLLIKGLGEVVEDDVLTLKNKEGNVFFFSPESSPEEDVIITIKGKNSIKMESPEEEEFFYLRRK